jgi:hypothetical protein
LIHGNSNDPVLIKRIALKIWTLRDEVEAVVARAVREGKEEGKELSPEEIENIRTEYLYKGPIDKKPNLTLVDGGGEEGGESGDDLEAEMAAAMGGGEEDSAEESGEEQSGEDLEAEMAAAMGDGLSEAPPAPEGPVKVIQRSSDTIPQSKIHHGISVLSEINMENFYFFSSSNFLEGQSVVIELQIPKKFVINADIVYCRPFNIRSRIISERKLTYRVAAKFSFLKEGERTLLRQFIQSIEPDIPVAPVKPAKVQEEDDGDDFDGLDGLDF